MKITANVNSPRCIANRTFSILGTNPIPIPKNIGSFSNPIYIPIQDKIFVQYNNGTIVNDYKVELITIGEYSSTPAWTSSNASVATVDSKGYVSYVSNGTCNITVSIDNQSITQELSFSTQTPTTPIVFFDHAANSLAKHLWTNIDTRTNGKTKSNAINIFSTQDHTNNIYIRNVNSWVYGADLSCFSPWNYDVGYMTAGTLISPRHVLFCKHFNFYPQVPRPDGQPVTIRFINQNNQTITRTLTNILRVNDVEYPNYTIDFAVGLLDSDITTQNGQSTGISFAKILPANWYKYLPSIPNPTQANYPYYYGVPALYTDQEEKALLGYLSRIATSSTGNTSIVLSEPTISQHKEFYEGLVRFDSGNPMFLIINNELVLLSVATGSVGGTFITAHMSQVNDVMSALGGGYQLTPVDLSSFVSY